MLVALEGHDQGDRPSEKKGYVLPHIGVVYFHQLRVVNSDEVQFVVRVTTSAKKKSLLRKATLRIINGRT